jgi:hypothetical protein
MGDPVYQIDKLRERVLELMRKEDRRMSTGEVAAAIGVEFWAVETALESAYGARQVEFTAGAGWRIALADANDFPEGNNLQNGLEL